MDALCLGKNLMSRGFSSCTVSLTEPLPTEWILCSCLNDDRVKGFDIKVPSRHGGIIDLPPERPSVRIVGTT